jgi:DNA-binding LacI/PurR family transcriptional regulator
MNIKDVAALAGVSAATVSRFINKTGPVCAQTARRIEQVISVTAYDPRQRAKGVDINHNPTLGVMIPSLLNPVFSEIVAGIQERARHFGFSTILVDTRYDRDIERQAVIDLIRQRVSGVILTVASVENNEALSLLKAFHFPLCLVYNEPVDDEPSVYVDNFKAGWEVADFLIATGHRHLGMVAGKFHTSDRASQRYAGFKARATAARDVLFDVLLEVDPNDTAPFEPGCLPESQASPSAWFCSNDLLALKLMNYFNNRGLRVPDDVSVVGFDGMQFGQLFCPPLATVKVPHRIMGICAVDLLFNSRQETGLIRKLDYEMSLYGSVQHKASIG